MFGCLLVILKRIIIVFTDEEPQTFLSPGVSDQILEDSLRSSPSLKFYGFVDAGRDGDEWEDMILAGSGSRFRLTSDANQMYNDLVSIIDEACLPRDRQANISFEKFQLASNPESSYDYKRKICY